MIKRNGRRVTHVRIQETPEGLLWTLYAKSARGTRYAVESFATTKGPKGMADASTVLEGKAKKN